MTCCLSFCTKAYAELLRSSCTSQDEPKTRKLLGDEAEHFVMPTKSVKHIEPRKMDHASEPTQYITR